MQPIDSIETYGYGTSKILLDEKKKIKCNNKTKQKMITCNVVTKENITEYNPNWSQISDHP